MFEKEIEMLEKLQNISHHHLDYVTCQSAMESLSNAEAELTQLRAEVERLIEENKELRLYKWATITMKKDGAE